jgi:pimeloyl-ACP methyl ester carboxylesterase
MAIFRHGELELAYLDEGEGEPILLVHGFGSSRVVNWVNTGWVETLTGAGRRVIALDNRGHGESSKPYEPEAYAISLMAEDAAALLDHLGVERFDVMGYSMGARISATLAAAHPGRVRSLVLGGLGMGLISGGLNAEQIAEALEAPSLAGVTDPNGRQFRQFAEQTRSDRLALAACMRGSRQPMARETAERLTVPTLLAVGTRDTISGSAHELAEILPMAEVLDIPNRDHMLAVGDKVFKQGVLAFLRGRA